MTFWNDFFCFENVGTLLIRQYHYIVPLEYNLGLHQLKYSYYKLKAKSYEPSICQDFCFTFGEFERTWSKAWSNTLFVTDHRPHQRVTVNWQRYFVVWLKDSPTQCSESHGRLTASAHGVWPSPHLVQVQDKHPFLHC
jgi:hypothetical protein